MKSVAHFVSRPIAASVCGLLVLSAGAVRADVETLGKVVGSALEVLESDPGYQGLTLRQRAEALRGTLGAELAASDSKLGKLVTDAQLMPGMSAQGVANQIYALASARGMTDSLDRATDSAAAAFRSGSATIRSDASNQAAEARRMIEEGVVARFVEVKGTVEVTTEGSGNWSRASKGMPLGIQDRIRTGRGAVAKVEFYDIEAGAEANPTVLNMSPESEVVIRDFNVSYELPKKRTGLFEMVRGALRAFTKGWGSSSGVAVRAGSTLCGIRGSTVELRFDAMGNVATTTIEGNVFTAFVAPTVDVGSLVSALQSAFAAGGGSFTVGGVTYNVQPLPPGQTISFSPDGTPTVSSDGGSDGGDGDGGDGDDGDDGDGGDGDGGDGDGDGGGSTGGSAENVQGAVTQSTSQFTGFQSSSGSTTIFKVTGDTFTSSVSDN